MIYTKFLKLLSIYLLVFYLLAEIFALLYFFSINGEWFYAHDGVRHESSEADIGNNNDGLLTHSVLHPVLGFIWRPSLPIQAVATRKRLDLMVGVNRVPKWADLSSNNYGFFSPNDYPFIPDRDAYIIGVFGGSVAQWFSLQGAERLKIHLKGIPKLRKKTIYIVNFAQGAFKQPQQLLILNYFLALGQKLDFVINIDGVNETVLAYDNILRNYEPGMPAMQQVLPLIGLLNKNTVSADYLDSYSNLRRLHREREKLEVKMLRNTHSAALQLIYEVYFSRVTSNYWKAATHLNEAALVSPTVPLISITQTREIPKGNDGKLFSNLAGLWMRSSLLMNTTLENLDVPYIHVIQPNQYFSEKKLSLQEKRIAFNSDSNFNKAVSKIYPYLLMKIGEMRAKGLNIVDATRVFDKEARLIYVDSCCHYNQLGNDLLANLIGREMAKVLKAERK